MIVNRFKIVCTTETAEDDAMKVLQANNNLIINSSHSHKFNKSIIDIVVNYRLAKVKTLTQTIQGIDNCTITSDGIETYTTDQERASAKQTIIDAQATRRKKLEKENQDSHKPHLIQMIKKYTHQRHDDAKLQSLTYAELTQHHETIRAEHFAAVNHLRINNQEINKRSIRQTLKNVDKEILHNQHPRSIRVLN